MHNTIDEAGKRNLWVVEVLHWYYDNEAVISPKGSFSTRSKEKSTIT